MCRFLKVSGVVVRCCSLRASCASLVARVLVTDRVVYIGKSHFCHHVSRIRARAVDRITGLAIAHTHTHGTHTDRLERNQRRLFGARTGPLLLHTADNKTKQLQLRHAAGINNSVVVSLNFCLVGTRILFLGLRLYSSLLRTDSAT